MKHRYMRPVVAAVTLAVVLSLGVATATAAAGGNSANAKICQKGGWMNYQGSDGTQFANQGKCVSYGAHGGTLQLITPTVTVTFSPTFDPNFCLITANLSHFAANTQYQVNFLLHDAFTTGAHGPFPVTTDSSGAASITPFSWIQRPDGQSWASASVGSVSSGQQTVHC